MLINKQFKRVCVQGASCVLPTSTGLQPAVALSALLFSEFVPITNQETHIYPISCLRLNRKCDTQCCYLDSTQFCYLEILLSIDSSNWRRNGWKDEWVERLSLHTNPDYTGKVYSELPTCNKAMPTTLTHRLLGSCRTIKCIGRCDCAGRFCTTARDRIHHLQGSVLAP